MSIFTERIAKNSFVSYFSQSANLGLGIVLTVILTRLLSPTDFGIYILLLSLSLLSAQIGCFGIEHFILRQLSNEKQTLNDNSKNYFTLAILFGIFSSMVVATAIYFSWSYFELYAFKITVDRKLRVIVPVMLVLGTLKILLSNAYRARLKVWAHSLFENVASTLTMVCFLVVIFLYKIEIDVFFVCCIFVLGQMVGILGGILSSGAWTWLASPLSNVQIGKIFHVSIPMFGSTFSWFLLSNIDIWVVALLLTAIDAGIYAIATRIARIMLISSTALQMFIPAYINRWYFSGELRNLRKLMGEVALLDFCINLLLFSSVVFFGNGLFSVIFGAEYADAHGIVLILGGSYLWTSALGASALLLQLVGYQAVLFRISITSLLVALILYYVVSDRWGLNGIASVAAFVIVLQNIQLWMTARYRLNMSTGMLFKLETIR